MTKTTMLTSVLLCLGATPAGAALILDDFTAPQTPGQMLMTRTSVSESLGGLSDVAGGGRWLGVNATSGAGWLTLEINGAYPDEAVLGSTSGISGQFSFAYGDSTPMDLNLAALGYFEVKFTAADLGSLLTLTMGDGTTTQTAPAVAVAAGPGTVSVPLSLFGGVDLEHVRSVRVDVAGPDSFDARIDYLAVMAVPEPTVLALSLLSLAALRVRRLRRSR